MFNSLQPGVGLGQSPSRLIAWSLGILEAGEIIIRALATFVATSIRTGFTAIDQASGFIADNIRTFFETDTPE